MNTSQKACAAIAAIITLSSVAMLAQKPAATGNAAVRAAMEAGNKKFADGAAKHDAALIASAYTVDAEAYPPNSGAVKGRPALQKLWQSVLDSGIAGKQPLTGGWFNHSHTLVIPEGCDGQLLDLQLGNRLQLALGLQGSVLFDDVSVIRQ